MRTAPLLLAGLGLALLAGCGRRGDNSQLSVYPVSGKVVLANGQPVPGARVRLTAKPGPNRGGADAFGTTQPDGTFKLQTMDNRDGAMPGMYKVVVEPADKDPKVSAQDREFARRNIPAAYRSEDTTTLEAEVKPSDNNLELTLK